MDGNYSLKLKSLKIMRERGKKYIVGVIFFNIFFFCNLSLGSIENYRQEAEKHYQKGQLLYEQGRYKEAQDEFLRARQLIEEGRKKEEILPASQGEEGVKKPAVQDKKGRLKTEEEKSVEYIIGEGDELLIKIWQNPDLDDAVVVRPDGMISFPLVEEINAAGLTIRQFKQNLTERLKEYIRYPQVSVSIKKMGGRRVIVLGQVKSPGIYSVTGRKTILEAVGLAGGFNDDAVVSSIVLIKGGFENPVPVRLNLTKALKRADLRDDVVLDSEDIIFIPRRFIADVNYFLKLILDPVSRGMFSAKEIRDW